MLNNSFSSSPGFPRTVVVVDISRLEKEPLTMQYKDGSLVNYVNFLNDLSK